jgi:hypothetical protein
MAEREDWTLFRTVEGLQQNAGVSASRLRRLVLKEFIDNPLDEGASVEVDNPDGSGLAFFVADDGPGIDGEPEEIANLFSIRRPMRSSKLLRLPRRGALGKPFTICDIPLAAHSPTERARRLIHCGSGGALVVVLECRPSGSKRNAWVAQHIYRYQRLGPHCVRAIEFADALDAPKQLRVLHGIAADDDRD